MTTTAASIILLVIYWALNGPAKKRLARIKFMRWLLDPQKAVLSRFNLLILGAAGFGLSQAWVADLIGWLNLEIFGLGVRLFPVMLLAGFILFLIDMFDGGGIKQSSYVIAFGMPIIAASSGGAIAALVISFTGGINSYAQTLMAGWV